MSEPADAQTARASTIPTVEDGSGDARAEAEQLIREAIDAHIESLREHGEAVLISGFK